MDKFLFFSSEAWYPAGDIIMGILYPIEIQFNKLFYEKYSNNEYLNNILIVIICTTNEMRKEGVYPERNYISWKNKYADMRCWIDYDYFMQLDCNSQKRILWVAIERALDNVKKKKALPKIDEFITDLENIYWDYSETE